MLQLEQVSVTYGGTLRAVQDVSLTVPDGASVALLGSNGAGKSTTLRAISQNLRRHRARITSGQITFDGEVLNGRPMFEVIDRGVVQVPEGRRILGRLSVEENLRVGGLRLGRKELAARREEVYELFPRLGERRHQRGLLLSGGEQQMLAIGRALMSSPKLIMFDEPSLGLAPIIVAQIADIIRSINAKGTSVLLIEQNANMALSVAQYAYVLELGKVSLEGKSEDLMKSDTIKDLYLGHSGGDVATLDAPAAERVLAPWKGDAR